MLPLLRHMETERSTDYAGGGTNPHTYIFDSLLLNHAYCMVKQTVVKNIHEVLESVNEHVYF